MFSKHQSPVLNKSLGHNFCHACQSCFYFKDARMSCMEATATERMSVSDGCRYLGELLQRTLAAPSCPSDASQLQWLRSLTFTKRKPWESERQTKWLPVVVWCGLILVNVVWSNPLPLHQITCLAFSSLDFLSNALSRTIKAPLKKPCKRRVSLVGADWWSPDAARRRRKYFSFLLREGERSIFTAKSLLVL